MREECVKGRGFYRVGIVCIFAGLINIVLPDSTLSQKAGAVDLSILDADDDASERILRRMGRMADMNSRESAQAWIVISSVALGMGIQKCFFPRPENPETIWRPATESLTEEEIWRLNRAVTSNFRKSEVNGQLNEANLFPVTRQAVRGLKDENGRWSCKKISEVWSAAVNYERNKSK